MSRKPVRFLALIAGATTIAGCLSHPATRAGDAHFEAGQPGLAAAAYSHGLSQGIDSESEREHVERQLVAIEQSFVDGYVDRALRQARDGDVEVALRISENDGWGNEAARDEADELLLGRLERALSNAKHSDHLVRIATIPRLEKRARELAESALEGAFEDLARQRGSQAVTSLDAVTDHPAWQIPTLPDSFAAKFIEAGDATLERLDPVADFEAFIQMRKERGFGHRPWDERAASVIETRVLAATSRANTLAQAGKFADARKTLGSVSQELPLTAEQQARIDGVWRRIATRRGNELLGMARENSGAPAIAYVYAALAQYYGVSGAGAAMTRYGRSFLGSPLQLRRVRIEPDVRNKGDCTIAFAPEPTVVGTGDGAEQVARITVNLYCGTTIDVAATKTGSKTETSSEYVTTETSESTYEYCKRISNSSAETGRCTQFMDSRSAAENESTLTNRNTERVVTDSWTTITVQLTGSVEVENLWGIVLEFDGKQTVVANTERTTKIPVSKTGSTREVFNTTTRRLEYSPPQVYFGLPSRSAASWDPRTEQLTTQVTGSEEYATPPGLSGDYSKAVERVRKAVDNENSRTRSNALSSANDALKRARQANDNNAVMAALLRISMLRASTAKQTAVFGELSASEQQMFKLTPEPLSAIASGMAGQSVAPDRTEPLALAEAAWEAPKPARFDRDEVSRDAIVQQYTEDAEHDVSPWRSTGLNQRIDLGPIADEEGSSIVELAAYAQGTPLKDAEIASVLAGRLTIVGTSLEAGFAVRPFEATQVSGFEFALRQTLRFEGSGWDPKLVPYFGVAYRQLQGQAELLGPDATRENTGFRFLGAEAGLAVPFVQWLSLDIGTEWNALWAVDLFDDEATGEFNAMSPMHGGLTMYVSSFYLHARGIYWLNAPDDLTPVGWRVQAGARF